LKYRKKRILFILIVAMILYLSPKNFMNHQTKIMIHRKGEGGE